MHHETHRRMSALTVVLIGVAAAFGTFFIVREIPAIRRYIKMEMM